MTDFDEEAMRAQSRRTFGVVLGVVLVAAAVLIGIFVLVAVTSDEQPCSTGGHVDGIDECP